jgi:LPS-assembly protein
MFFLRPSPFVRVAGGPWHGTGVCLAGGLLAPLLVWAQETPPPELLQLRNSTALEASISPLTRSLLPTFITGDSVTGRPDLETVVQGHAVLRKANMVIHADRLEYNQPTDLARATGQVRVNRAGNVYEGPLLELRVDAFEGFFNQPTYQFLKNQSHGQASRVDFLDEQRAVIHNATFTTCKRTGAPDWMPDWILRATQISMDNAEDVGTAEGAVLSFKGLPILPIPYVTFPLSDQRKSGLLPPTIGLGNVSGFELAQPYYWNIAPNRDATFTPTLMTKRGLELGTEFRYLESNYSGSVTFDWMPTDQLRNSSRWSLLTSHQAQIPSDWTDNGLNLNLSLNRVSDDNYWRDFSRSGGTTTQMLSATDAALLGNTQLTQRLLANDARLSWTNGPFSSMVRTLKWQTLQDLTDTTAAIVPPYNRLPQLATHYARSTETGLNLAMDLDYTQFESNSSLTHQPNGKRMFSMMQVSRSWQAPEGFITPKLQLNATQYQFDTPLSNGESQASRVLPTFSLDSGLVFERDASFFSRNLRQTLEPRAFYVHTPYRDQSLLPNYDSGANDFNLSTIYTENAFVGNDRISDSNLLTLGVTTRLLDPDTGAEAARFGVAQRVLFADQKVTLPGGVPLTDRISDLLIGGSVNWDPRWRFDGTVQYNPDTERTVRSTLGASYRPGRFRLLSAAYRFQRDSSEQIDLGWQWPLANPWGGTSTSTGEGRWYSVGRLNYSVNESQMVNAVLGFEYDAGCWLGRVVFERLQTGTASATQSIMFQLEFVGFSRLGVNPLQTLKNNIPGYQNLREPAGAPSRFSNYD